MFADNGVGSSLQAVACSLAVRVRKDSLFRNSIYIMATTVISAGVGYFFWVVAARMYVPHDVGLAAALIQAIMLASMLSNPGIHSTLVQVLPHRAAGRSWSLTLNAGLATGIFTGLLAGIVAAFVLPRVSSQFGVIERESPYVLALIVGVPLWTVSMVLDQTFVAERTAAYMLARQAAFAALRMLLLTVPFLLFHVGAGSIIATWILASAGSVLWGALLFVPRLRRAYCFAIRGLARQVQSVLKSFTGHHLINLGGALRVYLLPALVATRISATEYAYFYTAWMLGTAFSLVSPAVATTLFAEGAHAASDIGRKARSAALLTGMLLIPAMLITLVGSRYILSSFGPSYAQHGVVLLLLLIVSAVPDATTNLYVSVLRVRRRLSHAAVLNLGMAALTLALAWVLLPAYGIAGAGLAWLVGETSGCVAVGAYILANRVGVGKTTPHGVRAGRGRPTDAPQDAERRTA